MAYIHSLIILLFLSVLSFNSFAAFPVPYATGYHLSRSIAPDMGTYSSLADLEAFILNYTFSNPAASAPYSFSYSGSLSAVGDVSGLNFTYLWGGSQYNTTKYTVRYVSYLSCPENSSLTGSQCSCNAGYEEKNGNSCELPKPPDPCEGLENYCAAKQNNIFDWQVKGKSKSRQWTCQSAQSWVSGIGDGYTGYVDDFPGCSKGCMGSTSGFDLSHQDETGAWYTVGQGKYVGSTCEPSVIADLNGDQGDEETPPEVDQNADKTCPNGFKGTVNGVSVCLPPKSSSGVTELETKDNGDGTKTESKTQVQCENGKCSITKNTTTTNSETNNVVNSSSVTTTVDQSDYCSKNPTAGVCKDETGKGPGDGKGGDFSGSCSAGFTCDGDAIQCAIAKEQHIRACQMNEDLLKTEEYKAWQSAKSWDGKSVTNDLPGNREFDISIKSSDEFIGSGSCPSDQTIDLPFGTSFTIPLSEMCPWLIIFGEGLVIVSYISGALIILRRQS